MSPMRMIKTAAVGAMIAAAFACGKNDQNREASNTVPNGAAEPTANRPAEPSANSADQSKPIVTLTGCLQEGSGHNSFVLTRVNEPTRPAKTSSDDAGRSTAEREQLREARNAYRLDPQGDVKLDDLVGKQVRVSGQVVDRSDLPAATSGTAGDHPSDRTVKKSGEKIDESDLAKVDVTEATAIANSCGGRRAKR